MDFIHKILDILKDHEQELLFAVKNIREGVLFYEIPLKDCSIIYNVKEKRFERIITRTYIKNTIKREVYKIPEYSYLGV